MLKELLEGTVVHSFKYKEDTYTFEIVHGNSKQTNTLTMKNFPKHKPLKFLDESVQIHETVMVMLKDQKTLVGEGWAPRGKTGTLQSKASPFKIGAEKLKILGSAQNGKIGVNDKLEPFFFTEQGWRFSASEIKTIFKLDMINKPQKTEINTISGILVYEPTTNMIMLPNGHTISGQMLKDLITLMRCSKLV